MGDQLAKKFVHRQLTNTKGIEEEGWKRIILGDKSALIIDADNIVKAKTKAVLPQDDGEEDMKYNIL